MMREILFLLTAHTKDDKKMNYIWKLIPINNFKYLNNRCEKITESFCKDVGVEYCHTIFCNEEYVWDGEKYLGGPPLFIITNSDSFRPYQLFLSKSSSSYFEQDYELQESVDISNDINIVDLNSDYELDALPEENFEYTCKGCTDYAANKEIGASVKYIRYKSKILKNIDPLSSESLPEVDFGITLTNLDSDSSAWYNLKSAKTQKYYFCMILSPGKRYGKIQIYNSNLEQVVEGNQIWGENLGVFRDYLNNYLNYIGQNSTRALNQFDKIVSIVSFDAIKGQIYYVKTTDIAGFSWGVLNPSLIENNLFFKNKTYGINNIIYLPKTTDQDLPITYTSNNPEVLLISGENKGLVLKDGQATLNASNAGNSLFNPVSKSIDLVVKYKV